MGEVGVNYRNEPFNNRLRAGGEVADVFSSQVHGDPATPVFRAYPNDPTMVRVLNSSDLPRVHTWGIFGHNWRYEQNDPQSNIINGQGGVNTGRAFNEGICAGSNTPLFATGTTPTCPQDGRAGDFLYGDRNFMHMQGGIWGLLRVHGATQPDLKPCQSNDHRDDADDRQPPPPAPAGEAAAGGRGGDGNGGVRNRRGRLADPRRSALRTRRGGGGGGHQLRQPHRHPHEPDVRTRHAGSADHGADVGRERRRPAPGVGALRQHRGGHGVRYDPAWFRLVHAAQPRHTVRVAGSNLGPTGCASAAASRVSSGSSWPACLPAATGSSTPHREARHSASRWGGWTPPWSPTTTPPPRPPRPNSTSNSPPGKQHQH